jgi:hypothetical protein
VIRGTKEPLVRTVILGKIGHQQLVFPSCFQGSGSGIREGSLDCQFPIRFQEIEAGLLQVCIHFQLQLGLANGCLIQVIENKCSTGKRDFGIPDAL